MEKQPTCEERIDDRLGDALEDIRVTTLYRHECAECSHEWTTEGDDALECPECGSDFVDTYTPSDQYDSYMQGVLEISPLHIVYRVGLSTGGPADGFYLYVDPEDKTIDNIEYYFQDWWDGAKRTLMGDELNMVRDMFEPHLEIV